MLDQDFTLDGVFTSPTISEDFPLLWAFYKSGETQNILHLEDGLIKELEEILESLGYDAEKDFSKAFNSLKNRLYLLGVDKLGPTTASAFLESIDHHVSEQERDKKEKLNEEAGQQSGVKFRIPATGEYHWSNEYFLAGSHLTWGELTKNGKRLPSDKKILTNFVTVGQGFGRIREKWDSPILINSAYRPPHINRAVGGSKRSQHLLGLALDLYPLNGDLNGLFKLILDSDAVGIGDGRKRGFVHVDWRRNSSRVVFPY